MRRQPYSAKRVNVANDFSKVDFDSFISNEWLNSKMTAIQLGRFTKEGKPSIAAIHMLVYRKQLTGKKVLGRLMFHIGEIQRVLMTSPSIGG